MKTDSKSKKILKENLKREGLHLNDKELDGYIKICIWKEKIGQEKWDKMWSNFSNYEPSQEWKDKIKTELQ